MGHGRPYLSVLIVSLLVSGTALRSNEVIAESSADQSLHDPVALTTSQNLLAADPYAMARFLETAQPVGDRTRLKDLELMCDGIAIVMLQGLGMDMSRLMSGVQRIDRFNRERFGTANNESDYPPLAERQVFARAMAARSAEAIAEVPVAVELRVIAHAALDAADLARASETLRQLLGSAGVRSRWRDCSGAACRVDPGSVAIDVLLLPITKLTEGEVHGEVTRDATTGVPTVLIYVPPIAERVRAIRSSIDGRSNPALATIQTGHLLGAAMAHEVGHALGLPHGARGVMKGQYTLDEALALRTSRLVFTAAESASMRSALRTARNSVRGAGPVVQAADLTDIVVGTGPTAAADREAVAAAVAMLPAPPVRIAIMDVTRNRPPVRDYLLTLDAFTVEGNGVIYLVQQSAVLEKARQGGALFRAMLATIIWHEMTHLQGKDEHGARKAEEDLWARFVRDGVCDQVTALRYLQALRKRPDDTALAVE